MAHRTRPQMSIETRAKLLMLAREAFGARGYAATSLDELMIAAGMTKGALYHHFHSKLGLFEALVDEIDEEVRLELEAITKAAGGGWIGLKAGCRGYIELMQSPELRRITLQDAPAVIADFTNRRYTQLCNASFHNALETLMDEGVVVRTDPHALASMIAGAVNRAATWNAAQPDPVAALPAALQAVDVLLGGLRKSKP